MTPHHFISNRSLRAVLRGNGPLRGAQIGKNFCWIPDGFGDESATLSPQIPDKDPKKDPDLFREATRPR